MKKFITFFILLSSLFLKAQTANEPIKIETSIQKISETEYNLIFTATLFVLVVAIIIREKTLNMALIMMVTTTVK